MAPARHGLGLVEGDAVEGTVFDGVVGVRAELGGERFGCSLLLLRVLLPPELVVSAIGVQL